MRFFHIVIFSLAFAVPTTGSGASEIKLIGAGAVKEIVSELLPQFEKETGNTLSAAWTGGAEIRKRIAGGETFDFVLTNGPDVDGFIQQGKVAAGSRVDLMNSDIGVAVAEDAPKPDIASSGALKQVLLSAKAIGYSTGPSGAHIERLVEQMGIAADIKPKLRQVPSGMSVGSLIASKQVDLGFQQISELLHYPGIAYIGPLPGELQYTTVYSIGLASGTKEQESAGILVGLLRSPAGIRAMQQHGMEPFRKGALLLRSVVSSRGDAN